MGNIPLEPLVTSVKHQGALRFLKALLTSISLNDEIIHEANAQPRLASERIFTKKQQEETILEEIINCINAQNANRSNFGLCISDRKLENVIFQPFCQVLGSDTGLTSIAFVGCQIDNQGIESLAAALKKNKTLVTLNLSATNLDLSGFKSLIQGISSHPNLKELLLDSTQTTDESIQFLANQVLGSTKTLRTIDLSNNQITNTGFDWIFQAAKSNVFLCDIRLKENPGIANEQTKQLGVVFKRNEAVGFALEELYKSIWTKINVQRRASQTMLMLGSKRQASSDTVLQTRSDQRELARGRARGGTMDANLLPAVVSNSNSDSEPLEDCGNSKSSRFEVGCAHTRGRRKDMQDAYLLRGSFMDKPNEDLFCVFDGHGSQQPAIHAAKNISSILQQKFLESTSDQPDVDALRQSFLQLKADMKPWAIQQGTTAVCCWIRDNKLIVANVGDSRAVLCRKGKAFRLTVDHKPDLPGETERIVAMGGRIQNDRVLGALAVTRAFGDQFAGELVSGDPYITVTQLNKNDEFLLIACDGLFDIFMDDVAVAIALGIPDPTNAAARLKEQAFISGSTDNISVVMVNLRGVFSHIEPLPEHDPVVIRGLWTPDEPLHVSLGNSSSISTSNESVEKPVEPSAADKPQPSDVEKLDKSDSVEVKSENDSQPESSVVPDSDKSESKEELSKEVKVTEAEKPITDAEAQATVDNKESPQDLKDDSEEDDCDEDSDIDIDTDDPDTSGVDEDEDPDLDDSENSGKEDSSI